MSVDPSEPGTIDDGLDGSDAQDAYDRYAGPDAYEDEPEEERLEAPREDAAEQRAELLRQRRAPMTGRRTEEADPADAADQEREVDLDEDEDAYR